LNSFPVSEITGSTEFTRVEEPRVPGKAEGASAVGSDSIGRRFGNPREDRLQTRSE
jgi:hypothetical protein